MSEYRYQLERYRGRSTRYICPQCKRKQSFTRYIDTYNNNEYISDNVGKCNRIDKCGYHYTPKQYYTDNPWKRDTALVEGGSLRPCGYHYTPKQYYTDNPWKHGDGELGKIIGKFPKSPSPCSNLSTFSKSYLPSSGPYNPKPRLSHRSFCA